MIRSYSFYIAKKELLRYEARYLENALAELQSQGLEIINTYRDIRDEHGYPEPFESPHYIITTQDKKTWDDKKPNIRETYFGRLTEIPEKWKPEQKFDIVLIERPGETGLVRDEILAICDSMNREEIYPIEIYAKNQESSAMGFITTKAADKLDFDYERSGLNTFIATILDDIRKENETDIYEFKNLSIKLTRNI